MALRGCRACEGTGYRGRVALYERLEIDPATREMVFRGEPLEAVRRAGEASGALEPLMRDGARKALEGMKAHA